MSVMKPVTTGLSASLRKSQRLMAMKAELDGLNRQLGTGKRSETLGGLGAPRSISLNVRASLAESEAFRSVAQRGESRAALMANALEGIRTIGSAARADAIATLATGTGIVPAAAQTQARARLETVVSALNSDFDGQYLFSGASASTKPVVSVDTMLNGTGGAAGVTQIIDERRQADLGDGLGRLTTTIAGGTVTLAEEVAGLPFGLKLQAVRNGLGGASASISGGALAVTFTGQPSPGETMDIDFILPDGSTERLRLTARAPGTSPLGVGDFAIGADPASTAANLEGALRGGVAALAADKLGAASAIVAAGDFFAGSAASPPRRIAGPPFATATAFAAPGARATVNWYQGEDDATNPRETQVATVDRGVTVGVGARANEAPFRQVLAGFAALAAGPVPGDAQFRALSERVAGPVNAMNGAGREIVTEIGIAREAMTSATQRHKIRDSMLQTELAGVEDAPIEAVSVAIMSLQTRLQASYQVTASIGRLNLADYLR